MCPVLAQVKVAPESTVWKFWNMVWDQQVPAIVRLTKNFDLIRIMCVQYWPR